MMVDRLIPLLGATGWSAATFFRPVRFSGVRRLAGEQFVQPEASELSGGRGAPLRISVFPSGPAGPVTYLGGSNLAITSVSQHPEMPGSWSNI